MPVGIAVIAAAVVLIFTVHTVGVFFAAGLVGFWVAFAFMPDVARSLSRQGSTGAVIGIAWFVLTLVLSASFVHTAVAYSGRGKTWKKYAATENRRTVIPAVLFGVVYAGGKIALTRRSRMTEKKRLRIE